MTKRSKAILKNNGIKFLPIFYKFFGLKKWHPTLLYFDHYLLSCAVHVGADWWVVITEKDNPWAHLLLSVFPSGWNEDQHPENKNKNKIMLVVSWTSKQGGLKWAHNTTWKGPAPCCKLMSRTHLAEWVSTTAPLVNIYEYMLSKQISIPFFNFFFLFFKSFCEVNINLIIDLFYWFVLYSVLLNAFSYRTNHGFWRKVKNWLK